MNIRDYEKILDAIPATGVYVIREDNHEILYCNSQLQKIMPRVQLGMFCHELFSDFCCNCPILTIGDKQESRSIVFDTPFGRTVDIVACRMLWEDSVPAFVISLTPHIESVDSVYQKIFQVNLTRDCFDVLKTTPEERAAGNQVTSLTLWAQQFAESGKIHPDDVPRFLNFIRLEHLKEALANHQKSLVCSYRRRSPNGFRWNTLEVLPDSTYTDEEQTVFLYVKDVHDVLKDSLEREETNVHMQEVIRILGEQRFCVCIIDLHTGEVCFIQEDGGLIHDNLSDDFPLWDNIIHSHFVNQMHMSYQKDFLEKFALEQLCRDRDNNIQKTELLCQWYHRENRYRYVSVSAYFSQESPTRNYAVLALQDVDERVRRELALTRRDMQMAAIIKSRFHVIISVHLDNDQCERIWINEDTQLQKVITNSYSEYFLQTLSSVVSPEDATVFQETLNPKHLREQADKTQDYFEEICQYRLANAPDQWMEQHVIYVRTEDKVLINILSRDITKEKLQAEMQQKAVQEQNRIIDSLSSMFFATYYGDLEQDLLRSVTQLQEVKDLLGSQPRYLEGLRIYADKFIHPADRAEYMRVLGTENLRKTLSPQHPFVTVAYRKLPGDSEFDPDNCGWIRATAVLAQTGADGKASSIVYVAQDVSESKQKEMREQRALQAACEAANHASTTKRDFLSRMSHDIRTPLNGIMGMLKIASDHMEDQDKVRDCLQKITNSSTHLLSLVNEVLDMSQLESGSMDLDMKSFNLNELLQETVSAVLPNAQAKKLHLLTHPMDVKHENVIGDSRRLTQIFLNILGNAIKFTQEYGTIEISIVERDCKNYGAVTYDFIFRDNGVGMHEQFIPHIFEPFSRAEDSRISQIAGVGLGMTIVQNLVRMMGGTVNVESSPGEGSQITVTLLLKLSKPIPEEHIPTPVQPASGNALFQGRRILLVEDNEINREIAMEIISETGASVECASNGKKGLERFEEMPERYYDLIFMDIQMPVMNGYEATRAIRKLPRIDASSIPILALSANTFADDIIASREAGMDDHLSKPLEVPRLLASLRHWLDEK